MARATLKRELSVNLILTEKSSYQDVCGLISREVPKSEVRCLQQNSDRQWTLTVKSESVKDQLLRATWIMRGRVITIAPASEAVTYVTVLQSPCELPDAPITTQLSYYGKVLGIRRGHWQAHPEWENGNRHVRMVLEKPIPSYLKVGPYQLVIKYNGQTETCRRCGSAGHKAAQCTNYTCFNCGQYGHRESACPQPKQCRVCGKSDHSSSGCQDSFASKLRGTRLTDPSSDSDTGSGRQASAQTTEPQQEKPEEPKTPPIPRPAEDPKTQTQTKTKTKTEAKTKPDAKSSLSYPSTADWAALSSGKYAALLDEMASTDPGQSPAATDPDASTDSDNSTISISSAGSKRERSSSSPSDEEGTWRKRLSTNGRRRAKARRASAKQ